MKQPRFDTADLVGQLSIALGRPRLPSKLRCTLFLIAEDFAEAGEVGLGRAQLLLGILAPSVKPGDARRLLQELSAFDRFRGNDCADFALADEGRRMGAGRRVRKQQGNIFGTNVAAIKPIGGTRTPLDSPRDLAFTALAVFAGLRSSRIETSAKSRGGRVAVPAKMTSSMPPPRSDLGLDSPIAQRIASSRLDLPQPLGPTTPVRPGSIRSSAGSTKLLKPLSFSRRMRK